MLFHKLKRLCRWAGRIIFFIPRWIIRKISDMGDICTKPQGSQSNMVEQGQQSSSGRNRRGEGTEQSNNAGSSFKKNKQNSRDSFVPISRVQQASKNYQEIVQQHKDEIDKLNKELDEEKAKVRHLEFSMQKDEQGFVEERKKLANQNVKLMQGNKLNKKSTPSMEEQLETIRQLSQSNKTLQETNQKQYKHIEKLNEKYQLLKNQPLVETDGPGPDYKKMFENLTTEFNAIKSQLDAVTSEKENFQQEYQKVISQLQQIQWEKQNLEMDRERILKQMDEAGKDKYTKQENQTLKGQLQQMRLQFDKAQKDAAAQIENLTLKCQQYENELDLINKQNTGQTGGHGFSNIRNKFEQQKNPAIQEKLANIQETNRHMKRMFSMEEYKTMSDKKNEDLEKLSLENSDLKQKVTAISKQVQLYKEQVAKTAQEKDEQIKKLQSEKYKLSNELILFKGQPKRQSEEETRKLQAKLKEQEVQQLVQDNEIKNLKKALYDAQVECDDLRTQNEILKASNNTTEKPKNLTSSILQQQSTENQASTSATATLDGAQMEASLQKIQEIREEIRNLELEVAEFRGNSEDKEFLHLEELLTRIMIKLDNVDSCGNADIRRNRKDALQYVQEVTKKLREAAEKQDGK